MVHYGLQIKPCLQDSFKFPKFQAALFQKDQPLPFSQFPCESKKKKKIVLSNTY